MRIVVDGAGAVGGVVGSLLHRAGTPVTLIAGGPHLAADRVLAAAGIAVIPESVDATRRGDLLRRGPSLVPTGGSTRQSLARGTGSVETDQLNGEIVRLGLSHRIPTPFNARVVTLAHQALASAVPPRSVDAATMLD